MTTKDAARFKRNNDSSKGKLLNDVESISKALYLDRSPSKSSSSSAKTVPESVDKTNVLMPNPISKHSSDGQSTKDKKSFWSWKPLKAFSHVRNRRFNCCFSLEVHTIEGLPSKFNDSNICVHWKRRDGEVVTRPIKVIEGVAEFEEKLTHTCSVYGSRSGPHHSAKYEAKHFLLYAAVYGNPKLDIGKHRVDLTRLLPLTLEELEDEKSSATWTTSFKLSGEAKGGIMNVSFGYLVLGDGAAPNNKNVLQLLDSKATTKSFAKSNQGDGKGLMRRAGSLPANLKSSTTSHSMDDVKVLHEVPPIRMSDLSSSVNTLYQKFDQENSDSLVEDKCEIEVPSHNGKPLKSSHCPPDPYQESMSNDENLEFSFIEKGTESLDEKSTLVEDGTKVGGDQEVLSYDRPVFCSDAGVFSQEEADFKRDEVAIHDCETAETNMCTKESLLEDPESVLSNVAELEKEGLDTPEAKSESSDQEDQNEDKPNMMMPSVSLDDVADTVADEFLSMLGAEDSSFSIDSEAEPESPRERLLREFEKEAATSGCSLFGFGIDEEDLADYDYDAPSISGWEEYYEDSDFLAVDQNEYPKIRAKVMEDLETQELMQEWGLDDMAFESSPPNARIGFGSPIDLPPEKPQQLPSLGEGLGPFTQTKTGGFLRSMNPNLFADAKSGGSLIMQVSNPVVVPAELGSGVMDVLQHLASVGLEKLSMQANKLMPLEDITGRTMQQIAWEAAPRLEDFERFRLLLFHLALAGFCYIAFFY